MKKTNFTKVLSLFLVLMMTFSLFTLTAFASSMNYKGKYGLMIPTNPSFRGVRTSYSMTGGSGKLYFYMHSMGYKKNVRCAFAIYSDKKMTQYVTGYEDSFPTRDRDVTITWDLSGVKSGVYYGKTYTTVKTSSGYVTDSGSIYTYTVTVNRIAAVTPSFSSINAAFEGTVLSWKQVKYADAYRVYRRAAGDKNWNRLTETSALSFTDTTAEAGVNYYYTLRAKDGNSLSKYDTTGTLFVNLAAPVFSEAPTVQSDNAIRLSWGEVTGASGYQIYRKTAGSDSIRLATIKGGSNVTFTDTTQKTDGTEYIYQVRAYSGKIVGLFSAEESAVLFGSPAITEANCENGSATLSWAAQKDAESYRLYKKTGDGEWAVLTETAETSFTDSGLQPGTKYSYSVTVIKGQTESSFNSTGTVVWSLTAPVLKDAYNEIGNSVYVSWSKVDGASVYDVYRKEDGGDWKLLDSVPACATFYFDTTEKKNDIAYFYTVRARSDNSVGGVFDKAISVIFMAAPEMNAVITSRSGNTVSWNDVAGATSYQIFRKTPGGAWSLLAEIEATAFVDKTAAYGKAYYYTVCAMNGSLKGSYGPGVAVNACFGLPEALTALEQTDGTIKVSWNAVKNAAGYIVYRKTLGGSWVRIGTMAKPGIVDKSAKVSGLAYYYTVRAYDKKTTGIFDPFGAKVVYLDTPVLGSASFGKSKFTVSWSAVVGASGYRVYRRVNGSSWNYLGTVSTPSYDDTSLTDGTVYTYTVRAVADSYIGGYDKAGLRVAYLLSPNLISASADENGNAVLTWEAKTGAVQYSVYRRTADTNWSLLAKTKNLTYTDSSSRESGTLYYYYVAMNNGKDDSVPADTGLSILYLASPVLQTPVPGSDGSFSLSWNAVPGAESVKVFRRAESETEWTELATVTDGTSYTDNTVQSGTRYSYRLCSVKGDAQSVFSAASDLQTSLAAPVLQTPVLGADGSFALSWNAVPGAESVKVFRRAESETEWTELATVTDGTSYTDSTVQSGTRYSYRLCSVKGDAQSAFSTASDLQMSLASPAGIAVSRDGENHAVLTWQASVGAESYCVFRGTSDGNVIKIAENVTELTFTDESADPAEEYTYYVAAVCGGSLSTYLSTGVVLTAAAGE